MKVVIILYRVWRFFVLCVLGMGPGSEELITNRAVKLMRDSDILIGAKRHINFAIEEYSLEDKEVYYITADLESMKEYILKNSSKNISILASGDPNIYGIGDYVMRSMGADIDIEIVSGISSIQYCFSRFRMSMNEAFITSSHGRDVDFDFLFLHDKVGMVTDKKIGPKQIATEIKMRGLSYKMYVGENLSYKNERLHSGDSSVFLEDKEYDMCVVILEKIT